MTAARDMDDPARLWEIALSAWEKGDNGPVQALIGAAVLPEVAVAFLCDVVAGKAPERRKGRPPERSPTDERGLVLEVMREWDALESAPPSRDNTGPCDAATLRVADRHGISDSTLRGIVEKLRTEGLTRDVWIRWLR